MCFFMYADRESYIMAGGLCQWWVQKIQIVASARTDIFGAGIFGTKLKISLKF